MTHSHPFAIATGSLPPFYILDIQSGSPPVDSFPAGLWVPSPEQVLVAGTTASLYFSLPVLASTGLLESRGRGCDCLGLVVFLHLQRAVKVAAVLLKQLSSGQILGMSAEVAALTVSVLAPLHPSLVVTRSG